MSLCVSAGAADDDEARPAYRQRLMRHVVAQVARRAQARRLHAAVVEEREGEAASRFARIDAERFPDIAGWWAMGASPCYRRGTADVDGRWREPLGPMPRADNGHRHRMRRRVRSDDRPTLDVLMTDFEHAVADASVVEFVVDPWPRRDASASRRAIVDLAKCAAF